MANNNPQNGLFTHTNYMTQNAMHSVKQQMNGMNLQDAPRAAITNKNLGIQNVSVYSGNQAYQAPSVSSYGTSSSQGVNQPLTNTSHVSSVLPQRVNIPTSGHLSNEQPHISTSGILSRNTSSLITTSSVPQPVSVPQPSVLSVSGRNYNASNSSMIVPPSNSLNNENGSSTSNYINSQAANENTNHFTPSKVSLQYPSTNVVENCEPWGRPDSLQVNAHKSAASFQNHLMPNNLPLGVPQKSSQRLFMQTGPQHTPEKNTTSQTQMNVCNTSRSQPNLLQKQGAGVPLNLNADRTSHNFQVPQSIQQGSGRGLSSNQQKHHIFSNRYPNVNNFGEQKQDISTVNQGMSTSMQPNIQRVIQNKPQITPYQQQSVFQQPNYSGYQPCVTSMGFNKLWGNDNFDLLHQSNILQPTKINAPKVTLGQEALDNANCSSDIFRCTMTKIPESNTLLQKSRLPLGILIHPFKDLSHLPVIQCNVIVRCRACRTYINPFVYFVDNKRWKCNLCYRINELPEEFQYDPVSKTYGDPSRRPEVRSSTIEYIAPAEYMLRPPQPAVYLFLLDISRPAIESGYLQTVCSVLLDELKNMPGDARTQIGFLAYDTHLHFFSLAEGLSQPHEMTVIEVDDVFLPCPDNLLVNLKDRMEMVTDLLNQLPTRYNNSFSNNSALGAALQVAHKMMSPTGGRITVFQLILPNVGPGSLISRENPSQKSPVDVSLINPANDFYKRLSLDCSAQQIAVDIFVLNSKYADIATISGISRFSGGCIHQFPMFNASQPVHNEALEQSFRRYLTRKIGFEAVMRIRCTRGLSVHTFHGNFFVRSTDLLSLPNVNPDTAFGMQVTIDENLSDIQTVCFQAALLYTSSKGERRIRVHTLCLPVTSVLHEVISAADQQCVIGLLAKMAVDRSMQSSLSDAREAFVNVAIDILCSYKMTLNLGDVQSGLMAPECLKLLPLYISALLKSTAFRTGATRLDDRVKAMLDMKTKPLYQLIQQIYPDLYPIHNLEECQVVLNCEEEPIPAPPHLQLTARCLESKGAFLMDLGEQMMIYVCNGVCETFLTQVLGVPNFQSVPDNVCELPILENPHNKRLHLFVNHLNEEKPFTATLQIIRDNSVNRVLFIEKLIEDRQENALSYHEFLQHIKSQVK